MPLFGLGTWKSEPGDAHQAVKEALRLGYRHVDCAPLYMNEKEIGQALAESFAAGVVKREELWVTSKLWNDCHAPEDVEPALRKTLEDLRLDHLDLYLVHWPVAHRKGVVLPESAADLVPLDELPLRTTWEAMQTVQRAGLARHIGVSNFSVAKLEALAAMEGQGPEVDQVEMHPYLAQRDLIEHGRREGVHITAYSPLGSPDRPDFLRAEDDPILLDDPAILEVAKRHGASAAQVLIAWALQRGSSVIPKSVKPQRLAENLEATKLELSAEDVAAIDALDRHRRYVQGGFWCIPGSGYTLETLWDE